jgi:hypothetical protein
MTMKAPISFVALAALLLGGATAAPAREYPMFERDGYPLTPHQLEVLPSTERVQEHVSSPGLTQDGMPASPHQLAVLRPHRPEHHMRGDATLSAAHKVAQRK